MGHGGRVHNTPAYATTSRVSRGGPHGGTGVMDPHGLHRMLHPAWFRPVHGVMARAVAAGPGERVIDVGAGIGNLSRRLARSGATVVCMEPDAASLTRARACGRLAGAGTVEFLEAAAEHIPLADASVDAAVASVTAHHWADRGAGFAELARIIRPGGQLVMAELRPAGPLLRTLRRVVGSKHVDMPSAATWQAMLLAAGFSDVHPVRGGWQTRLAVFLHATR